MFKQGLILGIDYTDDNCQATFFNIRHNKPESVTSGTDVMRYLIPTALLYDAEKEEWKIGNAAYERAQLTGAEVYTDFLKHSLADEKIIYGENKELSFKELFGIYLGMLIEMAENLTGNHKVLSITVNINDVTLEKKELFEEVFEMIGYESEKIKLLSCSESFAYFLISENIRLWENGSILLDFSKHGLIIRLLTIKGDEGKELIFIDEIDKSGEFSIKDLASEMMRAQLDERLNSICEDLLEETNVSSVYFTGVGFDDIWFENTLRNLSEKVRVFKGNNIYAKGACILGYRNVQEQKDYPLVSKERTKARVMVEAKYGTKPTKIIFTEAAMSWYDASYKMDFIVNNTSWVQFHITSLLSRETTTVDFEFEDFPKRPNKATRIEIGIKFLSDSECEISVTDKGFGEFFESSGKSIKKRLDLRGYV